MERFHYGLAMIWICRLLGGLSLEGAGQRIERFRTEKTALLLGYLAFYRGCWFKRITLADMLWEEGRNPDASFRTALSSLRKQLEPVGVPTGSVLQSAGNRIRLNPDAVETDLVRFQNLLQCAQLSEDPSERLSAMTEALRLYQGELLHGYEAEWLLVPRAQLEQEYLRALQKAVPDLLQMGEGEVAQSLVEQTTRIYPLSEMAAQLMIRVYLSLDLPDLAEAAYQQFQSNLASMLGDYPRFTLESLKSERLPVGKARRVQSTPVASLPKRTRTSVPAPLTRFFGREEDMAYAMALLQQGVRLITITGSPGIGKTRLGQELGLRLEEAYAGRVFWISLRDARCEEEVQRAFVQAFDCGTDVTNETLVDALATRIGDAPALLITDNWEQVLDAAPLLAKLLQRLPCLQAIALSRHPLELEGERWLTLNPLPLPNAEMPLEALQQTPAIALFVDRAQAVRPDFVLTPANAPKLAQLCRILESVPLAIELAAAQLCSCSLSQLLHTAHARLDWLHSRRRDLGYPYRSLQAALESSYALLSPELQRAFAQLACLQGEWDEALAEAVLGHSFRRLLEDLTRYSLLQRRWSDDTPVYSMLESVRLFGQRKGNGQQKEAVRSRLFAFFEGLGKRVRVEFNTAAQLEWLHRLRRLYPNLFSAMEWGVSAVPRRAARLLVDYGYFLDWEQRWEEARRWCVRLLSSDALTQRQRAQLLSWQGLFLLRLEQHEQAERCLLEGIHLCRRLRDWDELAGAYNMLGVVKMNLLCYEEAERAFERGEAAARRNAHPIILAPLLHNWGILRQQQKRYRDTLQLAYEARTLYEQTHTPLSLANTLNLLGVCHLELREYDAAHNCFEQAATHYQTARYHAGIAMIYNNLAEMAIRQGDLRQAINYIDQAQRVCREGSCPLRLQGMMLLTQARLALLQGQTEEAERLVRECRQIASAVPELVKSIGEWEAENREFQSGGRSR